MNNEVWKDIKGYEKLYQISSLGNVRSIAHYDKMGRLKKGKIIKQQKNSAGYLFINLCKNGKVKQKNIHRIVAETFLDNYNNLPQVNHKDENKQNNCVDNLEWCTSKYNANYGNRNIKMKINLSGRNNKKSLKILQYDLNGNFIKEWYGIREAGRKMNIASQNIWACCKGKQKTAGGYLWKYC